MFFQRLCTHGANNSRGFDFARGKGDNSKDVEKKKKKKNVERKNEQEETKKKEGGGWLVSRMQFRSNSRVRGFPMAAVAAQRKSRTSLVARQLAPLRVLITRVGGEFRPRPEGRSKDPTKRSCGRCILRGNARGENRLCRVAETTEEGGWQVCAGVKMHRVSREQRTATRCTVRFAPFLHYLDSRRDCSL